MAQTVPAESVTLPSATLRTVHPVPAGEDVWIPSVCRMCGNGCGVLVHRVDGVVVKVEGNPENPHNFGKLCAKGQSAIMALYDPHRLRSCLRRTNRRKGPGEDPGWQEISWEEAMEEVVARLRKIAADDPRKLMIAHGTAEVEMPSAVASSFAEAFGTPNFSTGVFFGTHTRACYLTVGSMHVEPDLEYCQLLILFGSQKGAVTGHDTMKSTRAMAHARARGMKLIVFDPVCSPIASKADKWIPIIPGTDGAVALSMLHVLLNELGIMDEPFLARQTNAPYLVEASGHYVRDPISGKPLVWDLGDGRPRTYDDPGLGRPALSGDFEVDGQRCRPALDLLREHVAKFPPERAEEWSTVPAATIRRVAREFGENARIGSTIAVDGVVMPYRPVCAFSDSRGSTCHSQGMWTGVAIQLLDIVVGAMDVPGGSISANIVGPGQRPRVKEGPDGMIVFGGNLPSGEQQYPGRKPRPPETVQLHELFPVGRNPRPMLGLALLDYPHLIPYQPEMLIIWGTNVLMSGADPRRMAQAFEKIPFVVGLGERMDETLECADLVIPVAQHLERLDFPMNDLKGWVTGHHWYYAARQPVVAPPPDVHHVVDVFLEWSARMGLLPEVNNRLNARLGLAEDQRLDPDRRYCNTEIVERRMKSMFGTDHDLAWFQKNGLVAWERTLPERYPRGMLHLPRLPVYFPHLIDRGQELKEVVEQLKLEWDLSLYQPLPTWYGCWSLRTRQPEQLFAVNYKLPFLTSTTTQYNPWLMELAERHRLAFYVTLNSQTARERGISDGDLVELEGTNGFTARAVARVSECVHPLVVAISSSFGHWNRGQPIALGKGVHYNSFIPLSIQGMEMLSADYDMCALVTIRRLSRKGD